MPDIICRRQQRTKNLLVVACSRPIEEGGAGQGRWQREANDGKLVNNYTNRIMKLKPEEQRKGKGNSKRSRRGSKRGSGAGKEARGSEALS